MNLIWEGKYVILPNEICKIVWDNATKEEWNLQSRWKLVNFHVDVAQNVAVAYVTTVTHAQRLQVYPIGNKC